MALEKTGLEAVLDGVSNYLRDARAIDTANASIERTLGQVGRTSSAVGEIVTGALRRVGELALDSALRVGREGFGVIVGEAAAAEVTLARLNAVIGAAGGAAALTADQAGELAIRYRDLAKGSDDAVMAIVEVGLRAGTIAADEFPAFIQTTLDLAQVMGDAETAATLLARAQEDPVATMGRLQRAGILFTQSLRDQVKALAEAGQVGQATALVIGRVAEATGGQAAAAAGTLSGKVAILRNHLLEWGEVMGGPVIDGLTRLVDTVGPILEALASRVAGFFTGLAGDAAGWGQGLLASFADGMTSAIAYVVAVLQELGAIIAGWLAPGSPPRLLPDLDRWGAEAMRVYLAGWTQADFSAFDAIGGTIEAFLRSLGKGALAETDLIPTILGSRQGIAQALAAVRATGEVTDAAFAQVLSSVGPASEALGAYLRATLEVEAASARAARAQQAVADVAARYDGEIAALDQQLTGERDKTRRKDLLAQMRAKEIEKTAALKAAREKAAIAKQEEQAAKTRADYERSLVQVQTRDNALVGEQAKLLDRLAAALEKLGAAGGGAGAFAGPRLTGGGFKGLDVKLPDVAGAVQAKLDEVQGVIDTKIAAIRERLAGALTIFDPLKTALGNLVDAFGESMPKIETRTAAMVAYVREQLEGALPVVIQNTADALDSLAEIWRGHGETVMAVIDGALRFVVLTAGQALVILSTTLALGLEAVRTVFDTFSKVFQGDWDGALEALKAGWGRAWAIVERTVASTQERILVASGVNLEQFRAAQARGLENIKGVFASAWQAIERSVEQAVDAISRAFQLDWGSIGRGIVDGIAAGISGAVGGLVSAAVSAALSAYEAAKRALGISSPSTLFEGLGENMMAGLTAGMGGRVTPVASSAPVVRVTGGASGPAGGVQVGPNYVSTPMTQAVFMNQFRQAVGSGR